MKQLGEKYKELLSTGEYYMFNEEIPFDEL